MRVATCSFPLRVQTIKSRILYKINRGFLCHSYHQISDEAEPIAAGIEQEPTYREVRTVQRERAAHRRTAVHSDREATHRFFTAWVRHPDRIIRGVLVAVQ